MAETLGRKVTISIGGVVVAVARTKSLTINNSPINITSDGDDGVQRMLSEPGEKNVEVSVEGLTDGGGVLMDVALSNNLIETIIFDYTTFTVTGDFFQASYAESLPYNEAVTFTAAYSSSGAVVKAAVV
jgi:predicted secreted protein